MKRIQRANPILAIALMVAAMLIWGFYRSGQPDRTIIGALEQGQQADACGAINRMAIGSDRPNAATMQEMLRIAADPSMPVFRRRYAIVAIQVCEYRQAVGTLLTLLEKTSWEPKDENLPSVILRALECLSDSTISPTIARCMNRMAEQPISELTHAMAIAHFAIEHPHRDFALPLCHLADRLAESDSPDGPVAMEVTLTAMTFQPVHTSLNDYLTRWLAKHPQSSMRRPIEQYLAGKTVR